MDMKEVLGSLTDYTMPEPLPSQQTGMFSPSKKARELKDHMERFPHLMELHGSLSDFSLGTCLGTSDGQSLASSLVLEDYFHKIAHELKGRRELHEQNLMIGKNLLSSCASSKYALVLAKMELNFWQNCRCIVSTPECPTFSAPYSELKNVIIHFYRSTMLNEIETSVRTLQSRADERLACVLAKLQEVARLSQVDMILRRAIRESNIERLKLYRNVLHQIKDDLPLSPPNSDSRCEGNMSYLGPSIEKKTISQYAAIHSALEEIQGSESQRYPIMHASRS